MSTVDDDAVLVPVAAWVDELVAGVMAEVWATRAFPSASAEKEG